jgi:hypothetical protein
MSVLFHSDIQYASRPPSSKSKSDNIPSAIELKTPNPTDETVQTSEDTLLNQYHSYNDEEKSDTQSVISQGIKSRQMTIESRSDDTNIVSQYGSKPSVNTSTTTGTSSISTITTQNHSLPSETTDISQSTKQSTTSKTSSNLPIKPLGVDHMSTVYEESEPSTISIPNLPTSSLSEHGTLYF